MTTRILTLTATNAAGSTTVNASVAIADTPPPPPGSNDIVLTEGVPLSKDISHLVPANADRYMGAFYERTPLVYSVDGHIAGCDIVLKNSKPFFDYDGGPLMRNSYPFGVTPRWKSPNDGYYVGHETGPHNPSWQYPPRSMPIPQPVGGMQRAITNGGKHVRAEFCPWDGDDWLMGGDYSSAKLIVDGHQDGRMLLWKVNPVSNAWVLAYPALGRTGEDMPLSPDIMSWDWDAGRQIWWITYGDARAGVLNETHWRSIGGLGNVWPKDAAKYLMTDAPVFVFDPKLNPPRYIKLGNMPWNINAPKAHNGAYHEASKRLYKLSADGLIRWLDTTLFETNRMAMPWASKPINLAAGDPDNLTGTGAHRYLTGYFESPIRCDQVKHLLYFIDSRTPAVLAITLPGHALGEHKIIKICDIPGMPDMYAAPMSLLSCAQMTFVFIAKYRVLVLIAEPVWEQVGPMSNSYTINVDTRAVTAGPRFPARPDGKPWCPGMGWWHPPTEELIVGQFWANSALPYSQPQTFHAYKYTPLVQPAGYRNPWAWVQLKVTAIQKPAALAAPAIATKSAMRSAETAQEELAFELQSHLPSASDLPPIETQEPPQ